jgi:hypothetical protein
MGRLANLLAIRAGQLGWTHQQGHKGKKGIRRGGVFLAVAEPWRAEMHKVRTDSRGWGRYVMREMLGLINYCRMQLHILNERCTLGVLLHTNLAQLPFRSECSGLLFIVSTWILSGARPRPLGANTC